MRMSSSQNLAQKCGGSLIILMLAGSAVGAQSAVKPEVSFSQEVMAVLAKAGCSAGACHGNQNGKGGFKLSLRGQDADIDYQTLTRGLFSLRVNSFQPEQSLLLLKPTTQVAHEGGLRFKKNSQEYEILRRWIAAGMPDDVASAAKLLRLTVKPAESVLLAPTNEVQLSARSLAADATSSGIPAAIQRRRI